MIFSTLLFDDIEHFRRETMNNSDNSCYESRGADVRLLQSSVANPQDFLGIVRFFESPWDFSTFPQDLKKS